MSVVIGQLQIDADGKAAPDTRDARDARAAGPSGAAPPRGASPSAAASPPPPVRVQAAGALRHYRERLARVRSS